MINKIDTLIFGCNSLIGSEISKRINKKKTLLLFTKPNVGNIIIINIRTEVFRHMHFKVRFIYN